MGAPRFVLASASPRRRDLLAHLGVTFEVQPADVDEDPGDDTAAEAAERLARRKAAAAAAHAPGAVVIGSDTIVALDGRLLAKPADAAEARSMLRALRGRTHEVLTGVAVASGGRLQSACARTEVVMRPYTDEEIEAWIATGEAFDKAGAYAIQDPVFRPVERLDGCECNVIGLPLWTLRSLLVATGVPGAAPDLERCARCPAREV